MPEARITLAETTIYLATSAKSNSAYMAINKALTQVEHDTTNRPVPLHLRNAPTKLMKDLGFGKGQKWEAGFHLDQSYLPEAVQHEKIFLDPTQKPHDHNAK